MSEADARLSRIDTLWSVVQVAHEGQADHAAQAQQQLLDRYGGAIRRYLMASVRDPEVADELYQEFALNFLKGAFRNANPDRGRFRSFVKTAVYHLIVDHQRRAGRERGKQTLPDEELADDAQHQSQEMDRSLIQSWREELLAQCWLRLQAVEEAKGKPYHTVLRFRVNHPDKRSHEMAAELSELTGRELSAGAVRVLIHRAREEFADLMLEEVQQSLDNPSLEQVESELSDLNLLEYCRPAIQRRRERSN